MSQEKVDKYKSYKKNRKENIKKEKRKLFVEKVIAWAVVAVVVIAVGCMLGLSAYNSYQAKLAALPTYDSSSFILSDYVGIQTAAAAEDDADSVGEAESEAEEDTEAETTEAAE